MIKGLQKLLISVGIASSALLGSVERAYSQAEGPVKVRTIPEGYQLDEQGIVSGEALWERGKSYEMNVHLDATPMVFTNVDSAQWKISTPTLTSLEESSLPTENDFFEGYEMFDMFNFNHGYTNNVRAVDIFNGVSGPLMGRGNLGRYVQRVNDTSPLGLSAFNLWWAEIGNKNNPVPLPYTIENLPFTIMPKKGDIDGNGTINYEDVNRFVDVLLQQPVDEIPTETFTGEYADWSGNHDGVLDAHDIQPFIENYLQNADN